jgi:hypothetical protein
MELLGRRRGGLVLLGQDRLELRNLAPDRAELAGLFQLATLLLHPEVKTLFAKLVFASGEFLDAKVTNLFDSHN